LQYERLQSAWEEITKSGATILFRGDVPANEKGFFFPVTLLDNPPEDASYVAQEIFGPIRSVFKYKTVDEAISRANNTSYGLGASVWGKNSEETSTSSPPNRGRDSVDQPTCDSESVRACDRL
jgi:acyl-CoA reductase-like NAD-dependent aldehyde dehydrogenase